jgi:hypothetical protein
MLLIGFRWIESGLSKIATREFHRHARLKAPKPLIRREIAIVQSRV